MKAVQRLHHCPANGAPGVVDQDIHPAEVRQHPLRQAVYIFQFAEVTGIGVCFPAVLADDLHLLLQLGQGARHQDHGGVVGGKLARRFQPDTAGGAGDHNHLAGQLFLATAVGLRKVHMGLPVVPQYRRVVLQLGATDTRALERCPGLAVIEGDLAGDIAQGRGGNAGRPGHLPGGHLERQQPGGFPDPPADQLRHGGQLELGGEAGAVGRVEHDLHDPASAVLGRLQQLEGLAVQAGLVGDGDGGVGDIIHRHDGNLAALDAQQRQPLGYGVANGLDGGKQVVGAVDLVHFAGDTGTHHGSRAVNPPGHFAFLAHNALGLEFGAVIGVGGVLPLIEHALLEHALETAAGDGDGTHVLQGNLATQRIGELHHVAGAFVIHPVTGFIVHVQVVHRRQVVDVIDLALELVEVGFRYQARCGDVTPHGHQLFRVGTQ